MIPKFRAWDKVERKMIEGLASISLKSQMLVTRKLHFYPFEDIELMQSTGLFDKSGNEIYAGHVVKFKNPYDKRFTAIGVVVWREDKACFGIDMEGTTEQFELYRVTVENYLTVIGNIYQDEHLLERDK